MQVDELLKERDTIHSSFTTVQAVVNYSGSSSSSSSTSKVPSDPPKADTPLEYGSDDGKDKSRKKWFNLNLNRSDKKG